METGEQTEKKTSKWLRLVGLTLVIVGFVVLAKILGWDAYFDQKKLRGLIEAAGPWGFPVYVSIFSFGELAHVPGMVFVAAGVYAYGKLLGGFLAYIGAVTAVTVSFLVVRSVGGSALAEIKYEFVKKLLAKLDERPITVVIFLRIFLWLAPAVNYVLGLSKIRLRDFVIGSAIGLILPIALAVLAFDWAIKTFLG